MKKHIPYTYLLRFKPTGQLYYGARWAKKCDPSDLWKTYFSSSKVIKRLREEYGNDAFEASVRKTFDEPAKAIKCEMRVHKFFDVARDPTWINLRLSGRAGVGGYIPNAEIRKKMSDSHKGLKRTPEQNLRQSERMKGYKKSPEHIAKIAAAKTGIKQKPESIAKRVAKNTGKRWSVDMKKAHKARMSNRHGKNTYLNSVTGERKIFDLPPSADWSIWHWQDGSVYSTPWGAFKKLSHAVDHPEAEFKTKNVIAKKCKAGEEGYSYTRL